jgi:hypothetical protein
LRGLPAGGMALLGFSDIKMPSLPEQIAELCERGLIPTQFRVCDIRKHFGETYAESYIRRALVLYSEKTGDYTYRWNKPRFRKIRHGLYEIVV